MLLRTRNLALLDGAQRQGAEIALGFGHKVAMLDTAVLFEDDGPVWAVIAQRGADAKDLR